ncbi:hypothetical protein GLW04_02185 [Halobacillus litoralis]|uniref:Uncharacterized protein n=1 Tax=Halobacillus litoralis TaxID=45668 RepID=A0A845DN68_9BACI|nr:hypothetical protein [Halobacillus litoralis]MYL18678.1 hypothetical protein [Halobacillus litoralis]
MDRARSAYRQVLTAVTTSADLVKKPFDQGDLRLALFPQASPPNALRAGPCGKLRCDKMKESGYTV